MPIYEYECQKCGEVFETIQKFSDPRLTECLCEEKGPVTKLVSAAAFHLKGSGWYVTDFRDKSKGRDKDKKDGAQEGGGGGSEGESDGAGEAAKDGAKSESSTKKGAEADSKPASGAAKSAAGAAKPASD